MPNSRTTGKMPKGLRTAQGLVTEALKVAAAATAVAAIVISTASPTAAQVRDAAAASVPRAADQAASSVSLVEGFAYMGVTFSLIASLLFEITPHDPQTLVGGILAVVSI